MKCMPSSTPSIKILSILAFKRLKLNLSLNAKTVTIKAAEAIVNRPKAMEKISKA
jgi:hypothetical protein